MKRVWIYCRIAHGDVFALEKEMVMLENFAENNRLKAVGKTSEIASELNFNRNGLKEIKKVTKCHMADMILTKDISRIGLNIYKTLNFIDNLKKYIEFKTLDNFENPKNTDDILTNILLVAIYSD